MIAPRTKANAAPGSEDAYNKPLEPQTQVAALFVARDGCYYGLPGVEPWDKDRDARLYGGPHPVVAHPPCARWCKLAKQVESRDPERFRVGDDGGCFAAALEAVRKWGGVLEHPAWSLAWGAHGLLAPPSRGWSKSLECPNEWVAEVSQACYGHRAQKMTWLLYVGTSLPPPLLTGKPVVTSATKRKDGTWERHYVTGAVERLSERERNATPDQFRDLLLDIARSASRTP